MKKRMLKIKDNIIEKLEGYINEKNSERIIHYSKCLEQLETLITWHGEAENILDDIETGKIPSIGIQTIPKNLSRRATRGVGIAKRQAFIEKLNSLGIIASQVDGLGRAVYKTSNEKTFRIYSKS